MKNSTKENNKPLSSFWKSSLPLSVMALFLAACASHNASHLPSPVELPGAIIGSAISNSMYNARRRKVESYVAQHYLALRSHVMQGQGQALEEALDAAGIKGDKRNQARNDLISNKVRYFQNTDKVADILINNFASLYTVSQADKRINGFSYTEARQVIRNHASQNFEALRQAIQHGQGAALEQLTSGLNISDAQKRLQFKQKAKPLYRAIYLEPVIVVLMVHT